MSIVTKTGDDGTTGLLFNRRVPKDHPRVHAYGSCDELNTAIGMAKVFLSKEQSWIRNQLEEIQKVLVVLMGELATLPEDRERYLKAGHRFISSEDVDKLTRWTLEIESQQMPYRDWATPGSNPGSAALEVARTTCRRAERFVFSLGEETRRLNPSVIPYLNRLSDLLWLLARKVE